MEILSKIVYSFILACSLLYIWHKLIKRKIDFKDYKLYITILGITVISLFNFFMVNKFIKVTLITIIFMFFFRYLFREKISKCIITPIYYQIIIMISETLYTIVLVMIFNTSAGDIINSFLGTFLTNVSVAFISIAIVQFKFVNKLYNSLINLTNKIKNVQLIPICLIVLIIYNIANAAIYYKIKFIYLVIFNIFVILFCCIIAVASLIIESKYNKVADKYKIATNSLKDYEDMMTKYRIANHENKNLLLTIRAMILNKEKDIPKYIDSIVEDKYEDDERLLFEMSVIPSGGLRATIYSKILKIREKNIKYSLSIDKKLSTIDFIELEENTIVDICKIIGIFIDNAIEEVEKLSTKNIEISLFTDYNKLNIKVSNNYKNIIDIEKIFESGYTTKGENHGYGLTLVKKIIEKSQVLENITEINKKTFSQLLIINYKK